MSEMMDIVLSRLILPMQRSRRLKHIPGIADVASDPQYPLLERHISKLGSDHVPSFGGAFNGGYALQQNPREFAGLLTILKRRGSIGLYGEIGVASGGTLRAIQEQIGFTGCILLDDGLHPRANERDANIQGFVENCHLYIGDSHSLEAKAFLQSTLGSEKLDVVMIDGDHSFEGVRADLALLLPYCRPGSLVVFHDTVACSGVEQVWINANRRRVLQPLYEFVAPEKPMGIGVATVPLG